MTIMTSNTMKKLPFFLTAIFLYACSGGKAEATDHKDAAYVTAKDFVKEQLNNPEEAEFDWTPKYDQLEAGDNYRIAGYVTSKNDFGVKKKALFKCVLHYKGGDELEDSSWELAEPVELYEQ